MKNMQAFVVLALIAATTTRLYAGDTLRLSLQDALRIAKEKNKSIAIAHQEESAAWSDWQDARVARLPQVGVSGSYQRFTRVTLFEEGLSGAHTVGRRPEQNSTALGLDASFTIFSGGRQQLTIEEQVIKKNIASLNSLDQTGNISLQVVAAYLDIIRLTQQDSLVIEQIRRAETRVRNIESLFANQRVTRSDVLRAQLNLSNQQLSREQTENDLAITISHLLVLLDLPARSQILPTDRAGGTRPLPSTLTDMLNNAGETSYAILRSKQLLRLQNNRIQSIKANNYPSLQFYSAYGLNYPNYLGFPPVDQFYLLGFVGLRVQYNISSLYQNRHKETSARIRQRELTLLQSSIEDNTNQEIDALYRKYGEALDRIGVAQESILQASANYKIVSAKYFNQLALLTDLLDADNLYLEARYSLIRSQTDALVFYYRILYVSGNL